jgi:hypothetical protein
MGSAGFAFGRRVKSYLAGAKYTDAYWSNVTLLLNGDTLTDLSNYGKPLTVNDTTISTTVKKFGNGSLAISDSTGVSISNTPYLLGTGDYTIEFWFKANNFSKKYVNGKTLTGVTDLFGQDDYPVEFWQKTNTAAKPYATLFSINTATGIGLACTRTGIYGSLNGNVITNSNVSGYAVYGYCGEEIQAAYDSGQWHQFTITKSAAGLMFFIDGWVVGNPITDISNCTVTSVNIGAGIADGFSGYIDDFRITAGVARRTSNFLLSDVALPYPKTSIPFESTMLFGDILMCFDLSANSFMFMGG